MLKRILLVAVVILTAFVGIVAGWQFALWVITLAALVLGVMHVLGVQVEATSRWSSALYGSDSDDANHWSRTARKNG